MTSKIRIYTLRPDDVGSVICRVKARAEQYEGYFSAEEKELVVRRRQDWAAWILEGDCMDRAFRILSCLDDSEVLDRAVDKAVGYLLGRELTVVEVNNLVIRNLQYLASQEYLARRAGRPSPSMEDYWIPVTFIAVVHLTLIYLTQTQFSDRERTSLLGLEER